MLAAEGVAIRFLGLKLRAKAVRVCGVSGTCAAFCCSGLIDVLGVICADVMKAFGRPADGRAMEVFKSFAFEGPTYYCDAGGQLTSDLVCAAEAEEQILKAVPSKVFEEGASPHLKVAEPSEVLGNQPIAEGFGPRPRLAARWATGENQQGIGLAGGLFNGTLDVTNVTTWLAALEVEQIPAIVTFNMSEVAQDGVTGDDDDAQNALATRKA